MVPNRASDSSSNVVACWPAAYDVPTLTTIKALVGLSGTKAVLHGGFEKESRIVLALPGL